MKEVTREQLIRTFYRPTREEIGRDNVPTAEDMAGLLSILPRKSPCAIAAELAARTGMRLREVRAIRVGDITDTGVLIVGSGSSRRRLSLDVLIWGYLSYIAQGKDGCTRLVPVSRQAIHGMLKRYSPWSFSDLRVGFATEFLLLGGDILALSLIMGMSPSAVCSLVHLKPPEVDIIEVMSPL